MFKNFGPLEARIEADALYLDFPGSDGKPRTAKVIPLSWIDGGWMEPRATQQERAAIEWARDQKKVFATPVEICNKSCAMGDSTP